MPAENWLIQLNRESAEFARLYQERQRKDRRPDFAYSGLWPDERWQERTAQCIDRPS